MKAISTQKAPSAIGPYSQAIKVGNLVYTSGQIPIDPATGSFVEGGIKEQTRQSLTNVKAILEEAGLTISSQSLIPHALLSPSRPCRKVHWWRLKSWQRYETDYYCCMSSNIVLMRF